MNIQNVWSLPPEDMDAEIDPAVQSRQFFQPLRAFPACFPVIGRHLKQGVDVLLTGEVNGVGHGNDLLIGKALIGGFLLLIGIGSVNFCRNDGKYFTIQMESKKNVDA